MRILLIVIKTTEKRKPKIYEGKQMRERLVNKLTFYIDKLHLQEVCCRSCFHPSVYTTCFLQSTFNSLVSIPDTRVLGEALLSSPTPTTTTKKNKNNPLLFPIQQSALEIMLYLELLCLSIMNEMLRFWETDSFICTSILDSPLNDPLWTRAVFTLIVQLFY